MDLSTISGWPVRVALLALLVAAAVGFWRVRRLSGRVVLTGVVVVLAGLNVAAITNPPPPRSQQAPQPQPQPQAAPLEAVKPSPVPGNGVLTSVDLPGQVSGFPARPAGVYLPPAWFANPRPRLPVLLLLHGTPGSPQDWTDSGGVTDTLDRWAAAHQGVTPIVVIPDINAGKDADTECVDSSRGNAETYLSQDLPALIADRYQTQPPGPHWAVAGLSEGGSCAAMLALRHPGQFGTFADYSGLAGPRTGDGNALEDTVPVLFGDSMAQFDDHEPSWLLSHGSFPGMGGWFEVGDADTEPLEAAQQLQPLAAAAGIDTRLVVIPDGGHDFAVWRKAFQDSLPWLAQRLGS